jgi:pyruvate formate lyase activating enzyme
VPKTLVGSRYELHVAREGAAESRKLHDYLAVYPADLEEAQEKDVVGFVHSYEVGTTVDGPGIRFVGFLTGCPLRCKFCHNPDTWHKHNGTPVPVSRAMRQIGKYANVLKVSGGGLTLSGGEPMVQKAFVTQIFRRCKALGLHTAIETSGRLGDRFSDEDLRDIDLVILDIKGGDPATHEKVCGHPLKPTLEFAKRLAALRRPAWIRFVLVPGLTDDPENIAKVARFVAPLKNVEWVEVLPFHQLGAFKWQALGQEYTLADTPPAPPALVARVIQQFRDAGCNAR